MIWFLLISNGLQIGYSHDILRKRSVKLATLHLSLGIFVLVSFVTNLIFIYLIALPEPFKFISDLIFQYYWLAIVVLWFSTGLTDALNDKNSGTNKNKPSDEVISSEIVEDDPIEKKIDKGFKVI